MSMDVLHFGKPRLLLDLVGEEEEVSSGVRGVFEGVVT